MAWQVFILGVMAGAVPVFLFTFISWMNDKERLEFKYEKIIWELNHPDCKYPGKPPLAPIFQLLWAKIRVAWMTREPYSNHRSYDE